MVAFDGNLGLSSVEIEDYIINLNSRKLDSYDSSFFEENLSYKDIYQGNLELIWHRIFKVTRPKKLN